VLEPVATTRKVGGMLHRPIGIARLIEADWSIQWLKRVKPELFRRDLMTLFELLQQGKIRPLVAQRLPLAQASSAHELLGKGGIICQIVLAGSDLPLASTAPQH
jgi:NADPH:quinone reductase-like Zn-dependent oxidoreductase